MRRLPDSGKAAGARQDQPPVEDQTTQHSMEGDLLGEPTRQETNGFCGERGKKEGLQPGDESASVYVPSAVWHYGLTRDVTRSGRAACGRVGEPSGRLLHNGAVPSQRLDRAVAVV